jgi:bacterioferritin-associated ferredoxin
MYLCVCKAVRVRPVQAALRAGQLQSVEHVQRATGASTACGACLDAVCDLVKREQSCAVEGALAAAAK